MNNSIDPLELVRLLKEGDLIAFDKLYLLLLQ